MKGPLPSKSNANDSGPVTVDGSGSLVKDEG